MTIIIAGTAGFVLIAAVMTFMARMPLRPGAYAVRRRSEGDSPMLTATLVPSHRAVAGRPSAASTARQVYRITDVPARTGARASERGQR
jgi:hypothetical protein